jgi:hypothetical protein
MSAAWTERERAQFIALRRQRSAVWQALHFFGSLRLAMILLVTIAAACAIATVCESNFNAKIAQAYIYKAPWFVFWLGLLCFNLIASALTRWPWEKHHAGFVVTHAGIILLLIGAIVGQKFGFEGSVVLRTSDPPTNRIVLNNTILLFESAKDNALYSLPFDVEIRPPSKARGKKVALPDSDLTLLVDGYSEKLTRIERLAPASSPEFGPGIEMTFASGMMNQTIPVSLLRRPASASTNDFFGRARIEWLDALPSRDAAVAQEEIVDETQMIFARFQPVIHQVSGVASGYKIRLGIVEGDSRIEVESAKGSQQFSIKEILGRSFSLNGEPVQISVEQYWPDFDLRDGKPVSISAQPKNPAVLVRLTGKRPPANQPLLELAPGGDGKVSYQISRAGVVSARGSVAAGDSIALGWADWQARLERTMPAATLHSVIEPAAHPSDQTFPGIYARLVDGNGKAGEPKWIGSGTTSLMRIEDRQTSVGFGLQTRPLDFTIALEKFEVPRDEGTDTPANFISSVRFDDQRATLHAQTFMNHPASFPTGWWRVITGMNYKFSQASWDPNDLNQTTLQVLHDPGWLLKWTGSLGVCLGIATMFYISPRKNRTDAIELENEEIAPEFANARTDR